MDIIQVNFIGEIYMGDKWTAEFQMHLYPGIYLEDAERLCGFVMDELWVHLYLH